MVGSWKLVERHGFETFLRQRKVPWRRRQQLLRSGLRQDIRRHGDTFRIISTVHGLLRVPQRSVQQLVADGQTRVVDKTLGTTVSWLRPRDEEILVTEADTCEGAAMIRRWVEGDRLYHEVTDARHGVMVTQLFDRARSVRIQRPTSLRSWTTRLRIE